MTQPFVQSWQATATQKDETTCHRSPAKSSALQCSMQALMECLPTHVARKRSRQVTEDSKVSRACSCGNKPCHLNNHNRSDGRLVMNACPWSAMEPGLIVIHCHWWHHPPPADRVFLDYAETCWTQCCHWCLVILYKHLNIFLYILILI